MNHQSLNSLKLVNIIEMHRIEETGNSQCSHIRWHHLHIKLYSLDIHAIYFCHHHNIDLIKQAKRVVQACSIERRCRDRVNVYISAFASAFKFEKTPAQVAAVKFFNKGY